MRGLVVPSSNCPSPSVSQAYAVTEPSASAAWALSVTGSSVNGVVLDAAMETVGAAFTFCTRMSTLSRARPPFPSATVSRTV